MADVDPTIPPPDPLAGPDYFLRATTEVDLQAALATMKLWSQPIAGAQGMTGGYRTGGWCDDGVGQFALCVIGTIYRPEKDAQGNPVTAPDAMGNDAPVMAPVPGFHANLRWFSETPLSPEVKALALPRPASPAFVFA